MTAADPTLRPLLSLVEQRLAAIQRLLPSDRSDSWAWRKYHEAARDLIAELRRDAGAEFSTSGEYSLRLAGIAATSSVSEIQLLKNWARAARGGAA